MCDLRDIVNEFGHNHVPSCVFIDNKDDVNKVPFSDRCRIANRRGQKPHVG